MTSLLRRVGSLHRPITRLIPNVGCSTRQLHKTVWITVQERTTKEETTGTPAGRPSDVGSTATSGAPSSDTSDNLGSSSTTVHATSEAEHQQQQKQQQSPPQQGGLRHRRDRHDQRRSNAMSLFGGGRHDPFNQLFSPLLGGGGFGSSSLLSPFRRLEQLFDRDLFGPRDVDLFDEHDRGIWDFERELQRPARLEIEENEKEFVLHVKAPGLEKENLKLNVKDDVLTISGQKQERHKTEQGESSKSIQFSRVLTLPDHVEREGIRAKWEKGELKITLPKSPKQTIKEEPGQIKIE